MKRTPLKRGPKLIECREPDCAEKFMQYNSTKVYCNKHQGKHAKPINKRSAKKITEDNQYWPKRRAFLAKPENHYCFIEGCGRKATTIEHTMGREGYADDYARENKISLYLDERFWKPCCWPHNGELENNPELSKKYQLSKIHGGTKKE